MSGASSGILAISATYPLIFLSTRAAVNEGKSRQTIVDVIRREGVTGLYSGLNSSLLGIAVTNGVYYYFYERTKEILLKSHPDSKFISTLESMLSSLIAGSATTIITNPVWVIQTSETVETMHSRSVERLGVLKIMKNIFSKEGFSGFWRGLGPALVLVINPIIQYTVFEQLKNILVRIRTAKLRSTGTVVARLSDWDFFLLGALSKLVATGTTYPYIVVKSRLQAGSESARRHGSSFGVLCTIFEEEGIEGLYKGMSSKLVQSVLTAAILFASQRRLFEIFKNVRSMRAK